MFVLYGLKSPYEEDLVLLTDDSKMMIAFYFIIVLEKYCEMFHALKNTFLLAFGYVIITDIKADLNHKIYNRVFGFVCLRRF